MTSAQTAKSRNPYLDGFLAPVSAEVTATDLKVTGHIPEHLDGRYLRNGSNPAAEVDGTGNRRDAGALQPARRGFMALCVPVDEQCEDVVQETLLRASQRQEVVEGNERSTRAWLLTVARDMISSNGSGAPEAGGSAVSDSQIGADLRGGTLQELGVKQ